MGYNLRKRRQAVADRSGRVVSLDALSPKIGEVLWAICNENRWYHTQVATLAEVQPDNLREIFDGVHRPTRATVLKIVCAFLELGWQMKGWQWKQIQASFERAWADAELPEAPPGA